MIFVYYIVDSVNRDGLYPFGGQIAVLPTQCEFPFSRSECRMMVPPRGYDDPAYQDN